MNDLYNLLLLLGLGAVVGLWLKLSVSRELAVKEARQQCRQYGLQLLDETVGLRGLRLRRVNGLRRIERCYGFEVSIDGHDREAARLWMLGSSLSELSLPRAGSASRESIAQPAPALDAPASNVVQLHVRRNRDADRLH